MTQPDKSPKEFVDSVFDAHDIKPSEEFKATVCSIIENCVVSLAVAVAEGELIEFYERIRIKDAIAQQADMDREDELLGI